MAPTKSFDIDGGFGAFLAGIGLSPEQTGGRICFAGADPNLRQSASHRSLHRDPDDGRRRRRRRGLGNADRTRARPVD